MLKIYIVLLFGVLTVACGQDKKATTPKKASNQTTYYFIRHAEKDLSDPSNRNPKLTTQGEERAQEWMNYFKDKNIEVVYSTSYERTMNTALPIANAAGLLINNYDPSELYSTDFQKETKGKNVVVVGHSNTTPAFVNKILGSTTYSDIDESEYGHLYTVTVTDGKASVSHKELD